MNTRYTSFVSIHLWSPELLQRHVETLCDRGTEGLLLIDSTPGESPGIPAYMNAKDPTPSQELHSREAHAPIFAELSKYDATTHFIGQSTIDTLSGNRALGETYCLAHHVTVEGEKRRLMLASLRYHDTFAKMDGAWLFAERLLCLDWLEERTLS